MRQARSASSHSIGRTPRRAVRPCRGMLVARSRAESTMSTSESRTQLSGPSPSKGPCVRNVQVLPAFDRLLQRGHVEPTISSRADVRIGLERGKQLQGMEPLTSRNMSSFHTRNNVPALRGSRGHCIVTWFMSSSWTSRESFPMAWFDLAQVVGRPVLAAHLRRR